MRVCVCACVNSDLTPAGNVNGPGGGTEVRRRSRRRSEGRLGGVGGVPLLLSKLRLLRGEAGAQTGVMGGGVAEDHR